MENLMEFMTDSPKTELTELMMAHWTVHFKAWLMSSLNESMTANWMVYW